MGLTRGLRVGFGGPMIYLIAAELMGGQPREDSVLDSTIADRTGELEARLDSYRRLAEVFHHVLSEQSLASLLERIADTLMDLLEYDTLIIYEADETQRVLVPVLARDQYADEIMKDRAPFGRGITGQAVERQEAILANQAHLDPRTQVIPGTPDDAESLLSIPLITKGSIKGALNIYRQGEDASFTEEEFEFAKRFGDAVALAIDNAHHRAELEFAAQTDSLTNLYNHRHFHERLRSELNRASRSHDACALLVTDIDDFKKVNDVFGHATGDAVLVAIADVLKSLVRASDVVCRLGGEEFAVIMSSCDAGDALGLAARIHSELEEMNFDPAGKITVSVGIAQGPDQAANPRELVACADVAMMTAKARGKNRTVLFEEGESERPGEAHKGRDVRSIAHLKMLQSLSGKLNRLNDVRQIGGTIANELRTLIDYHSCRVHIVDDQDLVPIAFRGEVLNSPEDLDNWKLRIGEGITGRVAQTGRSLLVPNSLDCEVAIQVPGTTEIEESLVSVPLNYGTRVIGAITISQLGLAQFDEDDVRLLEVLAGHAAVALENARLYESQRRETEHAKAMLEFADTTSRAPSQFAVANETARVAAGVMDSHQASLWLEDERDGDFVCIAHCGYIGDPTSEPIIRERVTRSDGQGLVDGKREPFALTPEVSEQRIAAPPGAVSRAVAIGPLHGLSGWIVVRHSRADGVSWPEDRLRLLAGVGYQASTAMQKSILYRDQKESADIANSLLDFSRELAAAQTIDEILGRTVELSARILGSPRTSVWLSEPDTGDLVAEAQFGYEGKSLADLTASRFPAELARSVLAPAEPFTLTDQILNERFGFPAGVLRATLAVAPLGLDKRIGAIVVGAPALGDYEFSERKMKLLAGIAHQAQLAINNAAMFESLEGTFISTVEALANALEAKDEYTSSHARWITDMALEVGHELGLDASTLKNLELGALFHDIGKIGIPTQILLKEGPLDADEWAIIRTHPELGEKILAPIEFLAEVRPIVRACHEHWDGNGYPDGKSCEEIPLESRIILVVDAFHAMTSDRPYRSALSLEEASRRLIEASGTEFDPRVVDTLLRLIAERPELALVD
jgi:diguanylate cyclase (GGDEF)-like protein